MRRHRALRFAFRSGGRPIPRESTPPSRETTVEDVDAAAFTNANVGDCLTWDIADDGTVSNFVVVDCEDEHRYEVADRVDLQDVEAWIGQFGDDAPEPDQATLLQLRDWVCQDPVLEYMDGKLDPMGRFVPAPILPPWALARFDRPFEVLFA